MKVLRIAAGPLDTNCYILIDEETRETAIDPGGNEERLTPVLEENKTKLKYFINSWYFDHTGAVIALKNKYKAKVFIAKKIMS